MKKFPTMPGPNPEGLVPVRLNARLP